MAHTLDIISVVCDDQSVFEPLLNMLISAGCVPELFRSADEFLNSKSYISTSCLIADMLLSTASGLQLYEQLIASANALPAILLVAGPDEDNCVRAVQAGVSQFLRKPLNNSELLACIKSTLKGQMTLRRRVEI
ncbi:response regulator [Bradyrhizobium sp. DASA03120]|uniref:response regulator n=1 Tax=Bradyrhizobium sp. SMVTL-02 TaxID=3395917 RepID=UPI003F6EE123